MAIYDLEIPNLDEFSLLKMIRESNSWYNLPVIILTSRETEIHRQKALSLGANAYLTKAFQPVNLLETVNNPIVEDTNICQIADETKV